MARQLFANNATATLATDIVAAATTLPLAAGKGALFPALTVSDPNFYLVTLENQGTGAVEICRVIARNGDFLNVTRGEEGMIARDFPAGTIVELRVTKETLDNLHQASAGDGSGPVIPPADNKHYDILNGAYALSVQPGPSKDLTQAQVDGITHANSPSAGNPLATMTDLAGAGGGSGLPANILGGLAAAHSPSTVNPFATLGDLPTGSGGTVLAQPIVDALNAAPSPGAANPFAVFAQLPLISQALPDGVGQLSVGQMRGLKEGSYALDSTTVAHPSLGSVQSAILARFGSGATGPTSGWPFAVAGALVKQGKSFMITLLQVDRLTDNYITTAFLWEDDGTLGASDLIGDTTKQKSCFKTAGQLAGEDVNNFSQIVLQLQARMDRLTVKPEDIPVSAGDLRLSFLYEPFCQLEGFASGANVFDSTARIVTIAWKTGTADPLAVSPKEVFTVNAGVFGHLIDQQTGAFVTIEQILSWISAGTKIQVQHLTGDSNIANLRVIPFTPNDGGAYAQALSRAGNRGLVSISPSAADSGALFRDGTATTAGRLAYKDPTAGNATKYPIFEGDPALTGDTTVGEPATMLTASPHQFAAGDVDQIQDIDFTGITGDFIVNFDQSVSTPAGRGLTSWFFTRNLTAGKRLLLRANDAGSMPPAPPAVTSFAYTQSTGDNTICIRSSPGGTGIRMQPFNFTVPAGTTMKVLFVAFFNLRSISGNPAPCDLQGLVFGASLTDGSGGTQVNWDTVDKPPVGVVAPAVCTLIRDYGNPSSPVVGSIYPKTSDVDATFFSNIHSVAVFAFAYPETVSKFSTRHAVQFFGPTLSNDMPYSNVDTNARIMYAVACRSRGVSPGVPITVTGASALSGVTAADMLHTGSAFNTAEQALLVAHEDGALGSNIATFAQAATRAMTAIAFPLLPSGAPSTQILGPVEITENEQLVPIIYSANKKLVRVCL